MSSDITDSITFAQLEPYFNPIRPLYSVLELKQKNKSHFNSPKFSSTMNMGTPVKLKTPSHKGTVGSKSPSRRNLFKKLSANNQSSFKIFYTDDFQAIELKFFKEIGPSLLELDLPIWWRSGDTLRFGKSCNYDIDKSIEVSILEKHAPNLIHLENRRVLRLY